VDVFVNLDFIHVLDMNN